MKKHQKHAKLNKPLIGTFGRNEVAFLGSICSNIDVIIKSISLKLKSHFEKICYVDADHNSETIESPVFNVFQDKIKFKSISKNSISAFEQKFQLADQNLFLVNGNHFEGANQIIIIDPAKESSLKKRVSQLSNIIAIVLVDKEVKIYPWLIEFVPDIVSLPIFEINRNEDISDCIISAFKPVPLKALILAGGKSTRMGEDKAKIQYHGVSQVLYLSKIFSDLNIDSYISVAESNEEPNAIVDKFIGLGPYGAILSAFQEDPNAAWLVMASDLPLVSEKEISELIKKRNSNKVATTYYNQATGFPDPLCTIYEPKAYYQMLSFLSLGYSCPRKVLINTDIETIKLTDTQFLENVNTNEERNQILKKLQN